MSEKTKSNTKPRISMIIEARKKMGLSQIEFIKNLHSFSKGECSIGIKMFQTIESEYASEKSRISIDMLGWLFRFTKIEPNKFFNL